MTTLSESRAQMLGEVNAGAPRHGSVQYLGEVSFGPALQIQRYRLENGLSVLVCEDHSAPVLAFHTWFRVGSRHERVGKTGLAHLFEHLMFNEMEGRPAGEFDRKLEEAGAESNAATWLDWTQYNVAVPTDQLALVVELEADRMAKLVLREPQVASEKEVVANERRYRVDDDVEGAVNELLYATAYTRHAYRWPTIGWMEDIEGFTTEDCTEFYQTFYAPNNATIVVVGDVSPGELLRRISQAYGHMPAAQLPLEDVQPEPPQVEERRVEVTKPTATEKVLLGFHGPAMGDFDHPAVTLLSEILSGGRASRLQQQLVRELELASEVRVFVGPFRDPGLIEVYASARTGHSAEELLSAIEKEIDKIQREAVTQDELDRARARLELNLLAGLDSVDGKASTIGFYDTVLARPGAAFERMESLAEVSASDVLRVARRYLRRENRSLILVRCQSSGEEAA